MPHLEWTEACLELERLFPVLGSKSEAAHEMPPARSHARVYLKSVVLLHVPAGVDRVFPERSSVCVLASYIAAKMVVKFHQVAHDCKDTA